MAEPGDFTPPKTPVSPKVIFAAIWAFAGPVILAAIMAGLGYLATDDGRQLLHGLPVLLQVMIYAAVAAVSAAIGGYLKVDPLRYHPNTPAVAGDPLARGPLDVGDA